MRRGVEIGERFTNLVVVEQVPKPDNRITEGTYYLCRCDCGNEMIRLGYQLAQARKTGQTLNCKSCTRKERNGTGKVELEEERQGLLRLGYTEEEAGEFIAPPVAEEEQEEQGVRPYGGRLLNPGDKFGRLAVVKQVPKPENGTTSSGRYYLCRCDCGNEEIRLGSNLKRALIDGRDSKCFVCRNSFSEVGGGQGNPFEPGERYGELTIVEPAKDPSGGDRVGYFLCRCDCGAEEVRLGHTLTQTRKRGNVSRCLGCRTIMQRGKLRGGSVVSDEGCRISCTISVENIDMESLRKMMEVLKG